MNSSKFLPKIDVHSDNLMEYVYVHALVHYHKHYNIIDIDFVPQEE